MALEINHPEVERLVRELVEVTGESVPQAVATSLRERLGRVKSEQPQQSSLKQNLLRIGSECDALPVIDSRDSHDARHDDKGKAEPKALDFG